MAHGDAREDGANEKLTGLFLSCCWRVALSKRETVGSDNIQRPWTRSGLPMPEEPPCSGGAVEVGVSCVRGTV